MSHTRTCSYTDLLFAHTLFPYPLVLHSHSSELEGLRAQSYRWKPGRPGSGRHKIMMWPLWASSLAPWDPFQQGWCGVSLIQGLNHCLKLGTIEGQGSYR